jgi:transcriptional antiterminator RfaH
MNAESVADSPNWYAVHTKPKQEERAESNLKAWQVKTFAPKIRERRVNEFTGKPHYLVKPLFPGYIFAYFKISDLLHKVRFTRGVNNVLSIDGKPTPIDDEIIEIIIAKEDGDGFTRMGEELRPGDKVIVSKGPLRNFVGIFEGRYKDEERVSILLMTVSYQNRLVLERDAVKKICNSARQ